jgi:hypothetical protein
MNKYVLVAFAVLMAFSLPFAATGCGGTDSGAPEDTSESEVTPDINISVPEPAVEPEASLTPDSDAPGDEDMTVAETAVEAVVEGTEAAGQEITAETIVGTKWSAGGMTFTFEEGGALKVNDQIPGTWSLDGTTLTVGAMGEEYAATVEGGKIIYDGMPLEPVS